MIKDIIQTNGIEVRDITIKRRPKQHCPVGKALKQQEAVGKLDGVLVEGQTENKRQESPKPSYNLFGRLVGHSNETTITINGIETYALIDSGSQITTI